MISVDIEVSSGGFQTIRSFAKIDYSHQLNGNGFFEVVVAGSDEDFFSDYTTGLEVRFYNNGVLDLRGIVDKVSYTSEGLMRLEGVELGASIYSSVCCDKASYTSNSNAVISKLQSLTNNKVALTNIQSSSFDSFRTHNSQTCLQVLSKLAELQGKDWFFDYSGGSVRVNLVNKKGNTKVALLNGGVDVGVVTKEVDDGEKVNKVTFIGAGEGDKQIKCFYQSGWSCGCPEVTCVDKSIATNCEAYCRAKNVYDILSKSKFNFRFDVIDFNRLFVVGDTVELFDKRTNTDAELRIVCVRRVCGGGEEFLELEVRSVDDRERAEDRLRQERELRSYLDNDVSMVQGADLGCLCSCVCGNVCNTSLCVKPCVCVCYAGAITSSGYYFGGYSDNVNVLCSSCFGDWFPVCNRALIPGCSCSCNTYLGHGVFINMNVMYYFNNQSNLCCCCYALLHENPIKVRIRNLCKTNCFFPSSQGIVLNCFVYVSDNLHRHFTNHCHANYSFKCVCVTDCAGCHNHDGWLGIPLEKEHYHGFCVDYGLCPTCSTCAYSNYVGTDFYYILNPSTFIWVPFDWYGDAYRLEVCVGSRNVCYCGFKPYEIEYLQLYYSYYGVLGHKHDGYSCNCDLSHCHCACLVGNVCYCVCYL